MLFVATAVGQLDGMEMRSDVKVPSLQRWRQQSQLRQHKTVNISTEMEVISTCGGCEEVGDTPTSGGDVMGCDRTRIMWCRVITRSKVNHDDLKRDLLFNEFGHHYLLKCLTLPAMNGHLTWGMQLPSDRWQGFGGCKQILNLLTPLAMHRTMQQTHWPMPSIRLHKSVQLTMSYMHSQQGCLQINLFTAVHLQDCISSLIMIDCTCVCLHLSVACGSNVWTYSLRTVHSRLSFPLEKDNAKSLHNCDVSLHHAVHAEHREADRDLPCLVCRVV